MTVKFANEPNPELVKRALEKFAVAIARSEREKAQNNDREPIGDEKSPQNRI